MVGFTILPPLKTARLNIGLCKIILGKGCSIPPCLVTQTKIIAPNLGNTPLYMYINIYSNLVINFICVFYLRIDKGYQRAFEHFGICVYKSGS